MDSSKDNCSVPREELPRASAVIVASRPLERPESVTVLGEDHVVVAALLRIGRISLIERLSKIMLIGCIAHGRDCIANLCSSPKFVESKIRQLRLPKVFSKKTIEDGLIELISFTMGI